MRGRSRIRSDEEVDSEGTWEGEHGASEECVA